MDYIFHKFSSELRQRYLPRTILHNCFLAVLLAGCWWYINKSMLRWRTTSLLAALPSCDGTVIAIVGSGSSNIWQRSMKRSVQTYRIHLVVCTRPKWGSKLRVSHGINTSSEINIVFASMLIMRLIMLIEEDAKFM